MSSPVLSFGSIGNVMGGAPGQSVAASGNYGVLLNASSAFQTSFITKETSSSAPTSTTTPDNFLFYSYDVATSITAAVSAGALSIAVLSASGISIGDYIGLENERVKVTAVSGNTLTITATQFAHANGAGVYLLKPTPLTLNLQMTAANTPVDDGLGIPVSIGPGYYFIVFVNNDTANSRTVWATSMQVTAIQ